MDNDKQFVYDSLELTMLGRELPDRLLIYRAINSDPQVLSAVYAAYNMSNNICTT